MKNTLVYIISFFLVLLIILFLYIKSVIDSIKLDFKIDNIFLSNFNLNDFLKNKAFVEVKVLFLLKLSSLTNIKIKDINLKVFYKDSLVAYSADNQLNKKQQVLISDKTNEIYHYFNVNTNSNLIELVFKIKNNLKYTINYQLSLKILGLTINYKDKYENN